jgi:hypothetical protein
MSWRLAVILFVLGVLMRIPFQTENLWAHDSVLYERAIERFDPLDQRPQPPGYLYYVLLIRGLDALTRDANRAMTLVSLVADAASVALLYLLAARLYDERTARISALFLLTAVTFWAYGGIAYPYTVLAALSIGCALLFWRAAIGPSRRARLVAASAAWGIAVGFRSDLAVFLAPLWLVAAPFVVAIAAVLARRRLRVVREHLSMRPAGALFGLAALAATCRCGAIGAALLAVGVKAPFATAVVGLLGLELSALMPLAPGLAGLGGAAVAVAIAAHGVPSATAVAGGVAFYVAEGVAGIVFGIFATAGFILTGAGAERPQPTRGDVPVPAW